MENIALVATDKTKRPRSAMSPRSQMKRAEPSLQAKFISAGLAASFADMMTFPLDVAKVRLQLQGEASSTTSIARGGSTALASQLKYRGLFGTLCTICKDEGPRGMYKGLVPGLQRQMCFASIRIGLYDSVKQGYTDILPESTSKGQTFMVRILAGITTGGMAVLCAQPTDVVKVRMQAQSVGPARYSGALNAYATIAREEGMKGLWKGTSPNVMRNAIVNASELVSYDLIKEFILRKRLLSDNMPCHFVSAFGAGFCTTIVASPVDVIKTRFMNSAAGRYSGVLNCAVVMAREEGPKAFYKGFVPSFMRMGTWNIVMFVSYEQLKRLFTDADTTTTDIRNAIELKQTSQRYM